MSSNKLLISVFEKQLSEFLENILLLTNNNNEIRLLKLKLDQLMGVSKTTTISLIHKALSPFEKEILSKNESFFLNMNIEIEEIKQINYLKNVYKHSTQENKDSIWKYILVLYKLLKKIMS